MGSSSDWETMRPAAEVLEALGVPHEVRVVSAHRTPDLLFEYAAGARARGLEAIIAGAGGAAHLPGMTAAKTSLPVLGVPVQSKALNGMDSLLSIVQMPAGIPVATFAIGTAGRDQCRLAGGRHHRQPAPGSPAAAGRLSHPADRPGARAPRPAHQQPMTVGIVGAGQLGRMLALAGYPLGTGLPVPGSRRGAAGGAARPGAQERLQRRAMRWTHSPVAARW